MEPRDLKLTVINSVLVTSPPPPYPYSSFAEITFAVGGARSSNQFFVLFFFLFLFFADNKGLSVLHLLLCAHFVGLWLAHDAHCKNI